MKVPQDRIDKARQLRFAGKSLREAARLAGLSPATLRKHEKGWVDSAGVHHPGWRADLKVAQLKSIAAATQAGAEILDEDERIALYAEVASTLIEKVREALPRLQVRNSREAKSLLSEARELAKVIGQASGRAEKLPPGVRHDVTFNEAMDAYMRSKETKVVEVEPPERPIYLGDVVELKHVLPGGGGDERGD